MIIVVLYFLCISTIVCYIFQRISQTVKLWFIEQMLIYFQWILFIINIKWPMELLLFGAILYKITKVLVLYAGNLLIHYV